MLTADREVVPPLSDDVQLSVEEYRNKLYEVNNALCAPRVLALYNMSAIS